MNKKIIMPSILSNCGFSHNTHAFRYRPDTVTKDDGVERNYSIEEISNSAIWHAAIGTLNDPFEAYAKSNRNELQELNEDEWFKLWVKCFAKARAPWVLLYPLSTDCLREHFEEHMLLEKSFMIERFQAYDFFGDFIQDFRETIAIASFTSIPDSRLMWGYYCRGMNGFCIIYNRERLLASKIRLDDVDYDESVIQVNSMDHAYSYRTERNDDVLIKIPKFKHREWSHETELRSLCKLEGNESGVGKLISVEKSCVDGVIIGNKVRVATRKRLEELSKELDFALFYAEPNLEKFIVDVSEYPKS
ncbi:DUF2971 domain-containing protein [Enterobacter sichuanensis]|uniref:DUF2971 domain-containing protein n=1 Tax=Enterobacter sichuanensis TaxID=2071710 RepID=UPI0036D2DBFB